MLERRNDYSCRGASLWNQIMKYLRRKRLLMVLVVASSTTASLLLHLGYHVQPALAWWRMEQRFPQVPPQRILRSFRRRKNRSLRFPCDPPRGGDSPLPLFFVQVRGGEACSSAMDGGSGADNYSDCSDCGHDTTREGNREHQLSQLQPTVNTQQQFTSHKKPRQRKVSDIILDVVSTSRLGELEQTESSRQLRLLFLERKEELLNEYFESSSVSEPPQNRKQVQRSMKRLLHVLAAKIPAIKQSPDIALRIVSAKATVDSGLAASLIATLAHVSEILSSYLESANDGHGHYDNEKDFEQKIPSLSSELLKDRRFEQLIECLVCGVDVPKRSKEYERMQLASSTAKLENDHESKKSSGDGAGNEDNEKDLLQDWMGGSDGNSHEHRLDTPEQQSSHVEEPMKHEGLLLRDCCRAAWGLAVLGAHQQHDEATVSDVKVVDLIRALSLRTRELLLQGMNRLCQEDLSILLDGDSKEKKEQPIKQQEQHHDKTIEERLSEFAAEIAEDAAIAMWTFGCVRVLSGISSVALFQVCSTVLCQNPISLREQAQNEYLFYLLDRQELPSFATDAIAAETPNIGSNDAVEKLARSEEFDNDVSNDTASSESTRNSKGRANRSNVTDMTSSRDDHEHEGVEQDDNAVLLDYLCPNEVSDILWALAAHGERDVVATNHLRRHEALSETAATVCDVSFDRILAWLHHDGDILTRILEREGKQSKQNSPKMVGLEKRNDDNLQDNGDEETERVLEQQSDALAEPGGQEPFLDNAAAEVVTTPKPNGLTSANELYIDADQHENDFIVDDGLAVSVALLRPEFSRTNEGEPKSVSEENAVDHSMETVVEDGRTPVDAATLLAGEEAGELPSDNPGATDHRTDFPVDDHQSCVGHQQSDDAVLDEGLAVPENFPSPELTATNEVESSLEGNENNHHPQSSEEEGGKAVDAATLIAAEEAGEVPPGDNHMDADDAIPDGGEVSFESQSGEPFLEQVHEIDTTQAEESSNGNAECSGVESAEHEFECVELQHPEEAFHSDLVFGPSELCSIAWTVTELQDSLRDSVLKQVARNIVLRGPTCLAGQTGSALSNLAQVIANVVVEIGDVDNSDDLHTVLEWIAEEAYLAGVGKVEEEGDHHKAKRLLQRFEPPVLSRLVFALAAARCSTSRDEVRASESVVGLVTMALEVAHEDDITSGPEDVAFILFAYLELVYPSLSDRERSVAEVQLGKLFVVVELALSEWESGGSSVVPSPDELDTTKETSRFVSFFGRSWSKLDHRKYEHSGDDFDDYTVPALSAEKTRLPLLKDFPIDPSTLSKLAWSSSRLSRSANPSTSDTLARVALRLFSSRDGRLLREECQVYDLASIGKSLLSPCPIPTLCSKMSLMQDFVHCSSSRSHCQLLVARIG